MRRGFDGVRHQWPQTFSVARDFRVLSAASGLVERDLFAVLSHMLDQNVRGLESFAECFASLETQMEKARRLDNWAIFIPLLFEFETPLKTAVHFTSYGQGFALCAWKDAEQLIAACANAKQLLGNIRFNQPHSKPHYCLIARTRARDFDSAWHNVSQAFYAMRGHSEWTLNFMTSSHSYPFPKAVRVIPHPPWCGGFQDGIEELHAVGFNLPDADAKPKRIYRLSADDAWALHHNLFRTRRKTRGSKDIRELVASAMRLYSQAVDEQQPHAALLGFWRVIEAITLSGDEANTNTIAKNRLALIVSFTDAYVDGMEVELTSLVNKRNGAVHKGDFDSVTQQDRHFIKSWCDLALHWLLNSYDSFATRSTLEAFFALENANDDKLQAYERVVPLIREFREKLSKDQARRRKAAAQSTSKQPN